MNSLLSYIETACNSLLSYIKTAGCNSAFFQCHWIISDNFAANIVQLGYQTCAKIVFGQRNEINSCVLKAQDVSKPVINYFSACSFPNCKKFLKVCRAPGTAGS